MKRRIAQTLAACIALVALGFLYKNQTTTQAVGTDFISSTLSSKNTDLAQNTAKTPDNSAISDNHVQTTKTIKSTPKGADSRLSAAENTQNIEARNPATGGTEGVNEEEEDEAPLVNGRRLSKQERINEAVAFEIEKTKDLAIGYVPQERMIQAFEQTRRLQADFANKKEFLRGAIGNARWIERGPGNVGGRTRAIMVDRGDPSGKTVFAGSVTGGIFKNTNITDGSNKWERVNDWLDNLTVSSLVQDPRAPKIMYAGTGDTDGNDARGLGIFKSTDAGKTWNILPSTLNDVFNAIATIVITPDNSTIYAATSTGVFRSKNGGDTWEKVLASGKIFNIQLASDKTLYASSTNTIYKSTQGGDLNTWTALTGVGAGWSRTEIAIAPSDPKVLYAVGSINGAGSNVYRSGDAGATWSQKGQTTWIDGCGGTPVAGDFTRGQAWYDLCILVDPNNANTVWIGGVDMYRTLDGGGTWTQASFWANCPNRKYAHADHHIFYFDPLDPTVMYSGNDGGVFRVNNAGGNFTIDERTLGYVTTQFYGCAIHADSATDHFLAGAQDNGTLLMRGKGISNTNGRSIGGDGFLTFIDQDQPKEIQIGSLYNGEWFLSSNNGASFSRAASSAGGFFCPADYDDKNNILYAQTATSDLFRWNLNDKSQVFLDLAGVRLTNISNIFSDENVNGRVYIGTSSGSLYRVNGANTGTTIGDVTRLTALTGNIASIDVERGNPEHILVTMSNYGLQSVYESKDGGIVFTSCDANNNLPDMPVRWGTFNPNDGKGAIIATNLGVWSTEALNGAATVWQPPVPGRGIPLVRTDRIEWRKSDKMMLAGTYGRGVWTSSVLGKSQAVAEFPPVTYLDVPVNIKGENSVSADRFKWLFSDNAATDTLENTLHTFKTVGKFDITLTINNDNALKTTNKIQVLPSLPTPYKSGTNVYAGSFEDATSDVHFGAWNTEGSKWERGSSSVPGKSGTHTGSSAFVLEKTANQYKKNTTAYLHTPNFDMSKGGIYQFSFWANYDMQQGYDGFKVEYTLDKGLSWKQLGSNDDADWFNYKNTSLVETAAFGRGESYFTGLTDEWTRFKLNVSPFAGSPNVAFRFVFKSDGDNVTGSGVAIDDVVLSRYDGKLETAVIAQSGGYDKDGTSINVNFKSQPEYFAQTFTLQISKNGRVWEDVETVKAKGVSSEELQDYPVIVKGTPLDLYYFRVKSVNGDVKSKYDFTFFTQPFAVRRNKDVPLAVNRVFPSPFTNLIGVTFTDLVSSEVEMNLYDDIGRLVTTQTTVPNGVYQELKVDNLAKGIYFLTVKIGDGKPETTKLFGAGRD